MKNQWLTPKGITATIVMIIAVGGAIVGAARYITLPEDVEAVQEDVVDLKKILQRQQVINDFYYQKEQRQPRYEPPEVEPPPPRSDCWNERYKRFYNCASGEWL